MTDLEFRATLDRLGFNQTSFAERLIELGDPRPFSTLLRSINNYARGASSVPGEVVVILNLMDLFPAARGKRPVRKLGRPSSR